MGGTLRRSARRIAAPSRISSVGLLFAMAEAGARAWCPLVSALLALALLLSATELAGAEQKPSKRPDAANAVVQTPSPERTMHGRSTRTKRNISMDTFRAEEIVPDICRGYSSKKRGSHAGGARSIGRAHPRPSQDYNGRNLSSLTEDSRSIVPGRRLPSRPETG